MQKGRRSEQTFRRGEVWWGEINAGLLGKHLEKKRRPYIVVSRNHANKKSPNITVVPCSCHANPDFITHAKVFIGNVTSVALCEQIVTVDKNKFYKHECVLSKQALANVMDKLKIYLGMGV